MDKSRSSSKTETENTVKLDTKEISLPLASSYDKHKEEKEPTEITIRNNKLARDYQSFSTMSVSLDRDRIPRKKKNKLPETSITGNKTTQDPDTMSKEAKVGIRIESTSVYK